MHNSESVDLEAILQNRCAVILGCPWADGLGCGRKGAAEPCLVFEVKCFSMFVLNQIRLWTGILLCSLNNKINTLGVFPLFWRYNSVGEER